MRVVSHQPKRFAASARFKLSRAHRSFALTPTSLTQLLTQPQGARLKKMAMVMHVAFQMPHAVVLDDATRTLFLSLNARKNEIMEIARMVLLESDPNLVPVAADLNQPLQRDFFCLATLFTVQKEPALLDAVRRRLSLAEHPSATNALLAEMKCMVDFLYGNLGVNREGVFPVSNVSPSPTGIQFPGLRFQWDLKAIEHLLTQLNAWRKRDLKLLWQYFTLPVATGFFSLFYVGFRIEALVGLPGDAENFLVGVGRFFATAAGAMISGGSAAIFSFMPIAPFARKGFAKNRMVHEGVVIKRENHTILKEGLQFLHLIRSSDMWKIYDQVNETAFAARLKQDLVERLIAPFQEAIDKTEKLVRLCLEGSANEVVEPCFKEWKSNYNFYTKAFFSLAGYLEDVQNLVEYEERVQSAHSEN